MKGRGEAATLPLASPTGSGSVQMDLDYQKPAFKMFPENGHAVKNGSYGRRERPGRTPDLPPGSREPRDEAFRGSAWMVDSSSQADSTDPHETLTETSTLTFVDGHTMENHSLHGVEMVYLKEFVLIDDDDDGDMSLREKTVTDFSVMDGRAAELVCGRLLSTSSCSLSEGKDQPPAPEAPPPQEAQKEATRPGGRCCFCTLL